MRWARDKVPHQSQITGVNACINSGYYTNDPYDMGSFDESASIDVTIATKTNTYYLSYDLNTFMSQLFKTEIGDDK